MTEQLSGEMQVPYRCPEQLSEEMQVPYRCPEQLSGVAQKLLNPLRFSACTRVPHREGNSMGSPPLFNVEN